MGNLYACPQCGGYHFNVTEDQMLICTSVINGKFGCGWRGKPPQRSELRRLADAMADAIEEDADCTNEQSRAMSAYRAYQQRQAKENEQ